MKRFFIFLFSVLFWNCAEKEIKLPIVSHSEKTQITDHSPIYISYDEVTGEALLNRNNLITTTHWIFHIDRRNSLYNAGIHIKKMQEKKQNPFNPHYNSDSKNYFSVANLQKKELAFMDFSATNFMEMKKEDITEKSLFIEKKEDYFSRKEKKDFFEFYEKNQLFFNGNLSFQDFIEIYADLKKENYLLEKIFFIKN